MNADKLTAALLCAMLVLGCSACGQPALPESAPPPVAPSAPAAPPAPTSVAPVAPAIPGITAENYPRVDGSTANLPLMAQVYSTVCGTSPEEAEVFAQANGTADAWLALANKDTDLLLVYEAPGSVAAQLEGLKVPMEIHPIGRDGLVFLVNKKNKADSLTQAQLVDIYTGKTTDWSAVGGTAEKIAPFQRNEDSGSQTMFLKLLMKDIKPMSPPTELVSGSMGSLIDGVATFDGGSGAIGYSVYYYAQEMYQNPDLKLLSVDGIAPTPQTIGDSSYPLVNDFFVAIRTDEPQGSPARQLRDWLLTDAGGQALTAAGYQPVE